MNDFQRGDIVTVEGYEGEWEITSVVAHSASMIAYGHSPTSYHLSNTKTGIALSTNLPMVRVTR